MHTLLKPANFKSLFCAFALILAASLAPNSAHAATASVSPQGETTDVRQVVVRFDADMVALGAQGAAPATLNCNLTLPSVQGRWLDMRTWEWELSGDLPPVFECDVLLWQFIQTLAGEPITGQRLWKFIVGGPAVMQSIPYAYEGSQITEQQIILLRINGPLSTPQQLRDHIRCELANDGQLPLVLPIEVLIEEQKLRELKRQLPDVTPEAARNWHAVRCEGVLPNDTPMRLRVSKSLSTDGVSSKGTQTISYRVRKAFSATVACGQLGEAEPPTKDMSVCDPFKAIMVIFSEPVSSDIPASSVVKLFSENGQDSGRTSLEPFGALRTQFTFDPPFTEGEIYRVELQKGIKDAEGRPLIGTTEATAFPKPVKMAVLSTYVGMLRNAVTLPFTATGGVVPLAVRRAEPNVPVQTWRLTGAGRAADIAAIAAWQSGGARISTDSAWEKSTLINVSTASGAMEFVSIKLTEPGIVLLQAQSPAYDAKRAQLDPKQTAEPLQTSALVQATNLNPTLRLGLTGQSVVWVTAIDSGLPVPQAELALYSCRNRLLWEGKTDAQGLATIPGDLRDKLNCESTATATTGGAPPVNRTLLEIRDRVIWLVVRRGGDMALLHTGFSDFGRSIDAGKRPHSVVHTILDRTLFKVGDTVNLQYILRRQTANGFAFPPPGTGRVEIGAIFGKIAELPISWDAEGSATSSWRVPANTRPGSYTVKFLNDRELLAQTQLQIEEFKAPVFQAMLASRAQWPGGSGQQSVNHQLSLSHLNGAAAAGQVVSLHSFYSADIVAPRSGFSFGGLTRRLPNLDLPAAPEPVSVTLDAKGVSSSVTVVPGLAAPATLQTVLRFGAGNGAEQTVRSSVNVWPGRIKLGLRLAPQGRSKPLQIETLALDENDRVLANQTVRLSAQPVSESWSAAGRQIIPSGQAVELCGGPGLTAGNGLLTCDWPRDALTKVKTGSWLITASATDNSGKQVRTELVEFSIKLQSAEQTPGELQLANGRVFKGGDTAQVLARPARLPAQMLLTIERENLLAASVHAITRDGQPVPVPVSALYAPNVQLRARYVYPSAEPAAENAAAALPLSSEQVASLWVDPSVFRLKVRVVPAFAQARSSTPVPVTIQLSREQGDPVPAGARITLLAVDEALLVLKPNNTLNLLETMFRGRAANVLALSLELDPLFLRDIKIGPNLGYVPSEERQRLRQAAFSQPFGSSITAAPVSAVASERTVLSKLTEVQPGDNVANTPTASDFSPLILWRTDLIADANGRASAELPLNGAAMRVRIVAIVTSGADLFGVGEASFSTWEYAKPRGRKSP